MGYRYCKRVLWRFSRWAVAPMAAFLISVPGSSQDSPTEPEDPRVLLESGIAAVEAADLDEESRTSVLELYGQALEQLEAAQVNRLAAEAFQATLQTAPAQAEEIRTSLEDQPDAEGAPEIQPSESVEELDVRLQAAMAELAAAETDLDGMDAALESEADRPELAREQIAQARAMAEDLRTQGDVSPASNENSFAADARRWWTELRLVALESEIEMLEQELLSRRMRLDLLNARREAATLAVSTTTMRVERLTEAVSARRRTVADETLEQAQAVLANGEPHPLVREAAEANIALVDELRAQVSDLELVAERSGVAQSTSTQLAAAFRSATRKLGLDRFGAPLGQGIREEREQFGTAGAVERGRRVVQEYLATSTLRLIEHGDELAALSESRAADDPDTEALEPSDREQLQALTASRRSLLEQSVANDEGLQQRLYALDDLLVQGGNTLSQYDTLLAEQLFRVRSTRAVSLADFSALPIDLAAQFSPLAWGAVLASLPVGVLEAPLFALLLIGAMLLMLQTGRLRVALRATNDAVTRIAEDSIKHTFKAVGLTIFVAARWPLLLASLGWLLMAPEESPAFAVAVATSLINTGRTLLLFTLCREIFAPDGPAGAHFRWDRDALTQFHGQASLFIRLLVPTLLVANVWFYYTPGTMGGALGLLELSAILLLLSWLFWIVLDPTRGPLRGYFRARRDALLTRTRYVWIPWMVLTPIALIILHAFGFRYAALEILTRLMDTLWLVLILVIVAGFVERWLLIARRRLTYDAAVRERDAAARSREEGGAQTGAETADHEIDEIGAKTDLVALDAGSHQLLRAALNVSAVVGFLVIWNDLLPVFNALDNLSLWSRPVVIDGIEQAVAVTLRDILLAAVVGGLGYVTARDFPALLEIILLRYEVISAGSRYAVTTLSRYAIVTLAVLAVLGMLGASWSQMGWAVAALSVGIGFGLQEIVANFISGLILLFERPIRVGDVITIGDASGTVTRIRIRATTVRDWESKELVVPNKEFITGRLLNWTLSDPVTRLLIPVGIAYGSDVDTAMKLMREAAEENKRVLDDPEPMVLFEQFADSSLSLTLRAWVETFGDRLPALTELHTAINRKFNEADIVIAFPQQDVHVYSHGGPYEPVPDEDEVEKRGPEGP